ncbi:MAG: hypothetical protein KJ718_04545 [Nanoarchaeota archaeon]|nr:hypothetical protein [Nanoarchaeota archaeon]MBU1987951.1 hypothetical protein [Nanoarchaeota archaeon]
MLLEPPYTTDPEPEALRNALEQRQKALENQLDIWAQRFMFRKSDQEEL